MLGQRREDREEEFYLHIKELKLYHDQFLKNKMLHLKELS